MKRDPQKALVSALSDYLGTIDVVDAKAQDWASATFVGMQHAILFSVANDEAAACKVTALPDIDLPMAGHFVADLRIVENRRDDTRLTVSLEVLTIEEN